MAAVACVRTVSLPHPLHLLTPFVAPPAPCATWAHDRRLVCNIQGRRGGGGEDRRAVPHIPEYVAGERWHFFSVVGLLQLPGSHPPTAVKPQRCRRSPQHPWVAMPCSPPRYIHMHSSVGVGSGDGCLPVACVLVPCSRSLQKVKASRCNLAHSLSSHPRMPDPAPPPHLGGVTTWDAMFC